MADQDVTPKVILAHLQNMQSVLRVMERKLDDVAEDVLILTSDVNALKEDMRYVKGKLDQTEVQVDNIDKRLDDIEVVQILKLRKEVRSR